MSENFDLSPAQVEVGVPWCIYGSKGVGKTALSLGLHGPDATVMGINFDSTALRVKNMLFQKNENIKVFDGARYIKETDMVDTGSLTIDYIKALVEENGKVDVIAIDPLHTLVECAEAKMRKTAGVESFLQGVEFQVWKQRKFVLRELHNFFMRESEQAVIYVTNEELKTTKEDFVDRTTEKVPQWLDIIMDQALVVVHVYVKNTVDGLRRYAHIDSSKIMTPATWELYDITEVPTLTKPIEKEEGASW